MNKIKNKVLSLILSFVMIFSAFAGTVSLANGDESEGEVTDDTKTTVTISEIIIKSLDGKEFSVEGINPEKNISDYGLKFKDEENNVFPVNKPVVSVGKYKKDTDKVNNYTVISERKYSIEKIIFNKNGTNYPKDEKFTFLTDVDKIDLKITLKEIPSFKANLVAPATVKEGAKYTFEKAEKPTEPPTVTEDNKTSGEEAGNIQSAVKEYEFGKSYNFEAEKYNFKVKGLSEGYSLAKFKDGKENEIEKFDKEEIDLQKDMEKTFFTTHDDDLKILINTPKADNTKITAYTAPNAKVSGTAGDTILKEIEADSIGKVVFDLGTNKLEEKDKIKLVSKANDLVVDGETTVTKKDIKEIPLTFVEVKLKDSKITGATDKGNKVEGYIYNNKTKKFIKLADVIADDNGKFELILKDRVILEEDTVYLRASSENIYGDYVVAFSGKEGEEKPDPDVKDVKRLSGSDRFLTSVEIAKESYDKAENIVIANGMVSADALTAGPLANELDAPILLVMKDTASKEVKDYIKESGAKNLFVVGGKSSITNTLVDELGSGLKVSRISGLDRYSTSAEVASKLIEEYGYKKEVLFAHGVTDSDALAASTYATVNKKAIILTQKNTVTSDVEKALKTLKIESAEIVGGINTISNSINKGLDIEIESRISGENRYETSLEVAKKLGDKVKTAIVVNGYKSADALTAGSLANVKKAAILLTDGEKLTNTQATFAKTLKDIETMYVAGGPSSVKEAMLTELQKIVEDSKTEEKPELEESTEDKKETETK